MDRRCSAIAIGRRVLKKQIIVCAAVLAASVGAAATAHAQYVPIYPRTYVRGLPPHQAIVVVRSIGMQPLSRPLRRGANYVVVASTRSGARMRIVIDAFDGTIVRMRPARMARLHRQPYRPLYRPPPVTPYAPAPIGAQPVPPRNIPGPRVANAPAAVPSMAGVGPHSPGPIPPRHTPLPRPRPKVAASSKDITGSTPVSKPPVPAHQPAVKPAPETAKPASPAPSPPSPGELKLVPVAPLE
jgi:hypothetical protein